MALKLFFCYAHEDEALLNRLKKQLKPMQRQNLIDFWSDRDINAGTNWEREIDKHLDSAQIILLLISPDFMNSDYCYSREMARAMERHDRGEALVIPIILRPADWQIDSLRKLQALPSNAKPVTSWGNGDNAFLDIANGIRKAVENLSEQTPAKENPPSNANNSSLPSDEQEYYLSAHSPGETPRSKTTPDVPISQPPLPQPNQLSNRKSIILGIGIVLFLTTVGLGIYTFAMKQSTLSTFMSLGLALLAVPIGALPFVPRLLPRLPRITKMVLLMTAIILLIISVTMNSAYLIFRPQASRNPKLSTSSMPTSTITATLTRTLPSVPILVQKNLQNQHATTIAATFPASVMPGNLIIVAISQFKGKVSSVTDDQDNSYTQVIATQHANSSSDFADLYYGKNVKGGITTVTVTFSIGGDKNVGIYEYSGINSTSPLDQVVTQAGFGSSPNGGALKTTIDKELYFVLGIDDNGGNTAPSGGTGYILENHQDDSTTHERFYAEYRISSPGSSQTNFSIAADSHWVVIGASFKHLGTPALFKPGTPFLTDPMTSLNNRDQWNVVDRQYVSCGFRNGGYDVKVPGGSTGTCNTNAPATIFTNFVYEIDMTIVSGVTNVTNFGRGAGLMFRYNNDPNGITNSDYGISFQQDGTYYLFAYNHGPFIGLGMGICTNFHQGANQTNLIDVEMQGSTMTVFVNDVYLISATDTHFKSGQIGVHISSGNAPSEVVFSNLQVWKL